MSSSLAHFISWDITYCQSSQSVKTKSWKTIIFQKSLKYRISLKHKVHSGYRLLLYIPGDKFCSRLLALPSHLQAQRIALERHKKEPHSGGLSTLPWRINSLIPITERDKRQPLWPWLPPRGMPTLPWMYDWLQDGVLWGTRKPTLFPRQPKLPPSMACYRWVTKLKLWP